MKSGRSFFNKGDAADSTYQLLRDEPAEHLVEWREYIESLWQRYEGSQDTNFLEDAKAHFLPRFWEMYLWLSMSERGCNPVRVGSSGSEFYIELKGRRYWVEAVCPGKGETADAIPEPHVNKSIAPKVPVDKIMLRYATAVRQKALKHQDIDIPAGRASSEDGYLLAISSSAMSFDARCGGELPYLVKAAYGLGPLAVPIDVATGSADDAFHVAQPDIEKSNGNMVSMGFLLDNRYPLLSGIIHSIVGFTNPRLSPGDDFEWLANAGADVPVPRDAFPWMRRWNVEGDDLLRRERDT